MSDDVTVTQADRDAAREAWRDAYAAYMDWYTAKDEAAPIRELAEAFARQRANHAQGEAVALRRIVYNLQLGGDRLCDALRKIAAGSESPKAVARAALDHKAAWLEPPAQDVAALVSALEPFAKAAEIKLFPIGYWTDDKRIHGTDIGFHITFGDLRRAAEALANYGAKP